MMLKRISLLILGLAALAPLSQAVVINGQLQKAGLEQLSTDPTGFKGRVYFNTTDGKARIHNGTTWQDVTVGGTVDASTQLTGITPVANGGTGRSTLTANRILIGNGTSQVTLLAPSTQGTVVTSTGSAWTTSEPSVTSGSFSSPNSERVERATFGTCSSGPCSPTRQSGSWITNMVRNNPGDYSVTIAPGIFSAAPSCTIATNTAGSASIVKNTKIAAPSATSLTISTWETNASTPAGSVYTDIPFSLICQGPR